MLGSMMSGIAEHLYEYEQRVAAVFQSQDLLSKNVDDVLAGLPSRVDLISVNAESFINYLIILKASPWIDEQVCRGHIRLHRTPRT
jgi:hypothetical protein